jgi:tRNA(fMet)-specific endonuclease VapC
VDVEGIEGKRVILDTNALSAFAEEEPGVMGILAAVERLALPVIVIGEYRYGIALSRLSTRYRRWLDGLITDSTVLDIAERTTLHYAALRLYLKKAGKPIPTNDLWIAALCRQYELPLLSRDHHFDLVPGIQRVNW